MSQQQAHSDQNYSDDSASYSAGYEEGPRYQGYSAGIAGQNSLHQEITQARQLSSD